MAHDVFVSYSSKDKTVADAVCAVLEGRGIRCWIAPRDVRPGKPYGEAIIEGIQGAGVMVLIFSSHANASGHIPKEVERAVSRGLTIIPLRIEDVVPASSLDYFISSVHWLDAMTPPLEQHLEKLAGTVQAILPTKIRNVPGETPERNGPRTVVPPQPVPHSRKQGLATKLPWIGGVALIILLVIGTLFFRNTSQETRISEGLSTSGEKPTQPPAANPYEPFINANGTLQAGPLVAQWQSTDARGRTFAITWPEPVDTLTLSPDGTSLSGGNQFGVAVAGKRTTCPGEN